MFISIIYYINFNNEIFYWWVELRDVEYLLILKWEVILFVLFNWLFDFDIVNFLKKCKDILYFFIFECLKVNFVNFVKLEFIFILFEDRKNYNFIERKNKKEIIVIIE